ncbi:MAG TPA: acyltransferase [Rheinheimera sp.]|uniref:acyltransferase n=1 Tax=Rheinheimera sp. TaxID=1869214 RepID=UPI002B4A3A79|nr:acyltransferase [Rheinheimera sp.]HJS16824.1 acyltransferase [Rheinheimera sp.]
MLYWLPVVLKAPLAFFLFSCNLALWGSIVTLIGIAKLVSPNAAARAFWSKPAHWAYRGWSRYNKVLMELFNKVEWQVSGVAELKKDSWYLLISNHKSWLDIPVLSQFALNRIPEPKFFLKEELKWVPFIGSGSWALDMPFMKRYSQAQVAKNPALKGKDIETTRASCEKFKNTPTTIINFVEGSRFTAEKHKQKRSPFRHLLPPKAGGIAFTLASMGQQFHSVLDITILYPDNPGHVALDMLCGRLKRVVVLVEILPVDDEIIGDYFNDEAFRITFQNWLNQRWLKKDQAIAAYHQPEPSTSENALC